MKKLLSVLLCLIIIAAGFVLPCSAADKSSESYPYIFIPGMVGWGTEYEDYDKFPYWGGGFTIGQYDNLIDILNLAGVIIHIQAKGD